jgi:hypothetical protein
VRVHTTPQPGRVFSWPARLSGEAAAFWYQPWPPTPERELMCWKLRLYCGHLIEQAAHYTHTTVHSAFTGSARCPECGLDPATIVAAEAVGLVGVPQQPPTARKRAIRPTREDLERKVRALEAEVARLRRRQ